MQTQLTVHADKNFHLLRAVTQGFRLTDGCALITKQAAADTSAGPDCIHPPESVSPPSCSQLSPLQPESRLMLLPYQRWRCLQLWGEPKRGREHGGGRGGQFPLTGWQPTGHQAHAPLAGGLSAGLVNLPDRSLQVPLIPLIQFILPTARMRPLSVGKIKLLLHSHRVSLCCPRDGKPNPLSLRWR